MAAYSIHINEWQRRLIITALLNYKPPADFEKPTGEFGLFPPEPTVQQEQMNLVRSFGLLPSEEAADPGVLHGFCL